MAIAMTIGGVREVRLDRDQIAALSPRDIARLSYDEMCEIVETSAIPTVTRERLHELDGEALVRLVYMASEYCRRNPS